MHLPLEAIFDADGNIRLLDSAELSLQKSSAGESETSMSETALLSEAALAED